MSGNIRLNPEELENFSREYGSEASQVSDMLGRLDGLIGRLQDSWEGGASRAFADQYEDHKKSFIQMQQLLEDISRQLESSAHALRDADADIASQIRG